MDISVVLITFNRRDCLRRTLLLYARQNPVPGGFELIVVDNGSTDDTGRMLDALQPELPYPLRRLRIVSNGSVSVARNRAIDAAAGEIVFFTGDDILPSSGLLAAHMSWHRDRYPADHVGVLGLVTWAAELEPTPFLRWLELKGTQFAFGMIRHDETVGHGCLYSCNVSLKRSFLRRTGVRFDERLRLNFEDGEFGFRLSQHGFELRYNANALAEHLHPTTLDSSLRRMSALGAAAVRLRVVCPDEFDRVTGGIFRPAKKLKRFLAGIVLHPLLGRFAYVPLSRLFERRYFADRVFAAAHTTYFLQALRQADAESRARPATMLGQVER